MCIECDDHATTNRRHESGGDTIQDRDITEHRYIRRILSWCFRLCVLSVLASCAPSSNTPSSGGDIDVLLQSLRELGCKSRFSNANSALVRCLDVVIQEPAHLPRIFDCLRSAPNVKILLHISDGTIDVSQVPALPDNVLACDCENVRFVNAGTFVGGDLLRRLSLKQCFWDPQATLDISHVSSLDELLVETTALSASQVKYGNSLDYLRVLSLGSEAADLTRGISPCPALSVLDLTASPVRVEDINRILYNACDIDVVKLEATQADDSTLRMLANRPQISKLVVSHTRVTSQGIVELMKSANVVEMTAIGVAIDDRVLEIAKQSGTVIEHEPPRQTEEDGSPVNPAVHLFNLFNTAGPGETASSGGDAESGGPGGGGDESR